MRLEFEKELNKLHKDIVKMGSLIEESIDDVIIALKNKDKLIAKNIIENDDLIDDMERKIERQALIIIARQQPIATDLRDVFSILKMVTDLERIADHCEDISGVFIKNNIEEYLMMDEIIKMIEQVKKMISKTIDAYIRKDEVMAREIVEFDDNIDKRYNVIEEGIISMIEQDNKKARAGTYCIQIAKYLERMADHSTNIAEWIMYYVTGNIQ